MTYYIYYINNYIRKYKACAFAAIFLLFSFQAQTQDIADIQLANEYLLQGEKDKALVLFEKLSKNPSNILIIHNNYLNLLLDNGDYSRAQEYLKQTIKRDPNNVQLKLDVGITYHRSGDLSRADKYFKDLIEEGKSHIQTTKLIASYLSARSLEEYAILAFQRSRDFLQNEFLYTLDLAMLYRIQGDKDKMVQEYLNYVTQSSANIQYVKNVMQALLSDPDDLGSLERLLYDRVQKQPNVEVYADLLIWVTLQQKNFYASFIQARAYDKRYNQEGAKCMEVAQVAFDNADFRNAEKIYRYVVKEFAGSSNYLPARLGIIRTRESSVKTIYPVNTDSVKTLVHEYESFIRSYPNNAYSLEAQRNESLLFAKYLNKPDSAIYLLEDIINNPRATLHLKSKSKLDLGDIYLLNEEPWEATLLYSQVEKAQRDNTLGYEAKLKNAKYFYYRGDFLLALDQLDILKEATSREIANDAMELSILIKENIATDSSGTALKEFANIELLLYQNKIDESLRRLENFGKQTEKWMSKLDIFEQLVDQDKLHVIVKSTADSALVRLPAFNQIAIMDDVYWLQAGVLMKQGKFDASLALLKKIETDFGNDVLADDAFFTQGDIYERQLKDTAKAMDVYREFLTRFPGSVYTAEVRKRYRILRGDFKEVN